MKKFLTLIAFFTISLAFNSCSTDDLDEQTAQQTQVNAVDTGDQMAGGNKKVD